MVRDIYEDLGYEEESLEEASPVMSDATTDYLKSIGGYSVLSREEEAAFFERIKAGDLDAANEFVKHNLKLVVSVAKGYTGKGIELDDLIQEGNLGLYKAIDKFDPARGNKFSTYAVWWIKQGITNCFKKQESFISLDMPRGGESEDSDMTIGDSIEDVNAVDPEEAAIAAVRRTEVAQAMECLTDREQSVLKMRYGFGEDEKTLPEVGRALGLSCEGVRRIEASAFRKMKRMLGSDYMDCHRESVWDMAA